MENEINLRKEPCAQCGASTWYHDLAQHLPQCHACYVKDFLKIPKPQWCICNEAFWQRGRYDPQCRHEYIEDLHNTIKELENTIRN